MGAHEARSATKHQFLHTSLVVNSRQLAFAPVRETPGCSIVSSIGPA
jgi:hypothetical protein